MGIFEALILGIIQGITEFLPISSSGHLVLVESFLKLDVETLKSFDVMVHLGTLTAIIIYFWNDVVELFMAFLGLLGLVKKNSYKKEYQNLFGYIVIGTIPAVIIGLLFEDVIDFVFRNTWYVGIMMIIVAEFFLLSEKYFEKINGGKEVGPKGDEKVSPKGGEEVGLVSAVIIGIAQAFALIPGISRSGATIATGLLRGIPREKAARFSFLLGIPAIAGAGVLTLAKSVKGGMFQVDFVPVLIGFISAAISGFIAVYFLMKFLKTHTLKAFSIYLFVVGGLSVLINVLF